MHGPLTAPGRRCRCHPLLVRGSADFWSRPEDLQAFAHDAVHARGVRVLEIPGGRHFLHLERADAGCAALLDAVSETLRPDP